MAKSRTKQMPKFDSFDKLVKFFDTHDMSAYWDQMPEVQFDVDITRRTHLIALDDDVAEKVDLIARAKRIPSKTLINNWLREKVLEQTKAA